jgi:Na+/H+ antiporter NhaA
MDDRERPTTNQPLNAPGPRPKVTPLIAAVGGLVLIALIFLAITLLRYNT